MDGLLPILCLLVGVAIPLLGIALMVRHGLAQVGAPAAYRQLSRELGLSVDHRGLSLHGHLGDRRIWIGRVMVGHGVERRHEYWGVVDLERPLGLGLLIRPRGMSERIFRRSRQPHLPIGDVDLDRLLEVHGDDPTVVTRLLDEPVCAGLRALGSRWSPVVTDHSVRVHLRQPVSSERKLRALVTGMMALAQAIERSRVRLPVPPDLASWVGRWADLVEAHGLELEPWLPAITGSIDGRRVVITVRRGDDEPSTDLWLYFRPHRLVGLRLRPQLEPDGYWSVGQDIQVGDEDFDNAFVIKGYDPVVVTQTLSEPVRVSLLQLLSAGLVTVDDRALHLRGGSMDPEELDSYLEAVLTIADGLGW